MFSRLTTALLALIILTVGFGASSDAVPLHFVPLSATSSAPTPPPTGGFMVSRNAAGKIVDGTSTPIQLRGANGGEMDGGIYNGNDSPHACMNGFANGGYPYGTFANDWKMNVNRVPLNISAFLNVNTALISGSPTSPAFSNAMVSDPAGVYKNCLLSIILWDNYYHIYTLIEDHFSAPVYTIGGVTKYIAAFGQPLFGSQAESFHFWTDAYGAGPGVTDANGQPSSGVTGWLGHWLGTAAYNTAHSIPGAGGVTGAAGQYNDPNVGGATGFGQIIFEIFNEPQLNAQPANLNTQNLGAGSTVTFAQCMHDGCWASAYFNQNIGNGNYQGTPVGISSSVYGPSGQPNTTGSTLGYNYWWQVEGYQPVLNGIRALGATNIVSISGPSFSFDFSYDNTIFPTDPLVAAGGIAQLAHTWHAYGNGSFPNSTDAFGSNSLANTANQIRLVQNVIAGNTNFTVGGTTFPGVPLALPVLATEFGSQYVCTTPDPYVTSIDQWADGLTDTHTGTPSPGLFHPFMWAWPDPAGIASSTSSACSDGSGWDMLKYTATSSITASVSTTIATLPNGNKAPPTSGVMTVTNANGNNLAANSQWIVLGGAGVNNFWIGPQLSGTAGGAGTYAVSYGQTVASTTLTIAQTVCTPGQGCTYRNYTSTHP